MRADIDMEDAAYRGRRSSRKQVFDEQEQEERELGSPSVSDQDAEESGSDGSDSAPEEMGFRRGAGKGGAMDDPEDEDGDGDDSGSDQSEENDDLDAQLEAMGAQPATLRRLCQLAFLYPSARGPQGA